MREILFKGKRKDWRELPKAEWWVEGYVVKHGDRWWIYTGEVYIVEGCTNEYGLPLTHAVKYEIEPETLCQYTELPDKNGKKIFEGDIVKHKSAQLLGVVKYSEKYMQFIVDDIDDGEQDCSGFINGVEIIGNIFDNTELLEVQE